jgi:hypothetical protein
MNHSSSPHILTPFATRWYDPTILIPQTDGQHVVVLSRMETQDRRGDAGLCSDLNGDVDIGETWSRSMVD